MVTSMSDAASRRQPEPVEAAAPSAAEAAARPARSLGRGLEELSPLFLSRRLAEAPAPSPASLAPVAPAAPTPAPRGREAARRHSGALLLRPATGLTREQVVETIEGSPTALEARLRTIDSGVPGGAGGPIDVLALDDAGRLVVIDVDLSATGSLLVRGLDHAEWITRNLAAVLKMYRDQPIDFSARPRLVLVAHDFSRALRNAIRQIGAPEVTCVRCRGLDVCGWTGLFFERIAGDDF